MTAALVADLRYEVEKLERDVLDLTEINDRLRAENEALKAQALAVAPIVRAAIAWRDSGADKLERALWIEVDHYEDNEHVRTHSSTSNEVSP